MIETTLINRSKKYFRTQDGTILQFCAMFDHDLNPTTDANACVLAVYHCDDDGVFKGLDTRIVRDEITGSPATHLYSKEEIEGVSFNRGGRLFRLVDGSVMRFAATLDRNLKRTNEADYIMAIVKLPFGLFRALDLRMFDDHPDMWETTH